MGGPIIGRTMGMSISFNRSKRRFASASIILVVVTFLSYVSAEEDSQEQLSANETDSDSSALYSVECGQVNDAGEPFCYVDRDTYVGWRTFHGFCHVCHAQDAVGSTFAPNLLDRMQEMDMDLFVERVNDGFTGQVGVMPPWKGDPNVNKRYKELYAYLKARSSGDLPPGRPKRKPKSN